MAKELTDSSYLLSTKERINHFKMYAGPGAGKTYFLANNINNIIESDKVITTSKQRKVLCITYTNAAANELRERLTRNLNRIVVSTIHGFISEYIIKPYQPLLKKIIKEIYGIDIKTSKLLHSEIEGRGLLFSHRKEDVYNFIKSRLSESDDIKYNRFAIESVKLSIDT